MKRIPKSFKLLGHTIAVNVIPESEWIKTKDEDDVGEWYARDLKIDLLDQPSSPLMHAFAHELTHAILEMMNHPIGKDEVFVDNFAGLLAQALATSR
jgi:hypothetical protein